MRLFEMGNVRFVPFNLKTLYLLIVNMLIYVGLTTMEKAD